jgi:hypothetical protein
VGDWLQSYQLTASRERQLRGGHFETVVDEFWAEGSPSSCGYSRQVHFPPATSGCSHLLKGVSLGGIETQPKSSFYEIYSL